MGWKCYLREGPTSGAGQLSFSLLNQYGPGYLGGRKEGKKGERQEGRGRRKGEEGRKKGEEGKYYD